MLGPGHDHDIDREPGKGTKHVAESDTAGYGYQTVDHALKTGQKLDIRGKISCFALCGQTRFPTSTCCRVRFPAI